MEHVNRTPNDKEILGLYFKNKFQIDLNNSDLEESYNSLLFLAKAISRYLYLKGNLDYERKL